MIRTFKEATPRIDKTAFVHPACELIGRVTLKRNASIWPMAVLRGDIEPITIGPDSNVQDGVLMHTSKGFPVRLQRGVTIGHGAILHGATVRDYTMIGMGAILLDGCVVGSECIVGAGALVPEGARISPRSLVLGVPGRVVRKLKPQELRLLHRRAADYIGYAAAHTRFSVPAA